MGQMWVQTWDLIVPLSSAVQDNCLVKKKGVPNPGKDREPERSLVRAQCFSLGKNVERVKKQKSDIYLYIYIYLMFVVFPYPRAVC